MGRPRKKIDEPGEAGEVARRFREEKPGWRKERLQSVMLGLKGEQGLEEIAAIVGRSRSTIQIWLDAYRRGGVQALLKEPGRGKGPASRLHAKARRELQKKLVRGSFRRAEDIRQWLEGRFGIEVGVGAVYHYLKKCAAGLKVPRPENSQKNPEAAVIFRAQLARQLHQLNLPKDRPVRVWVADECRLGLHPIRRRAWVLKGCRARKESAQRYDWQYVWGAIQVGGGGSEFFYSNGVDVPTSLAFLRQIAARDPHALHVIIWDGAGFHPADTHPQLPGNIRLLNQPAYSPELNPVEKLWDMLKDALCNRRWKNLDALFLEVTRFLRSLWSQPQRLFHLIGQGWMLSQVNASFDYGYTD
jgi:transposase